MSTESVKLPQAVLIVTVYSVVTGGYAYVLSLVGFLTVAEGAHE